MNNVLSIFRALLSQSKTKLKNKKVIPGGGPESFYVGSQWCGKSYYGVSFQYPARFLPQLANHLVPIQLCSVSRICTTTTVLKKQGVDFQKGNQRTPTQDDSPAIILIDTENKVCTTSLMKAGKLAKRKDLKLVKIDDPTLGTKNKVYKLLTGKQYYEENLKAKKIAKTATVSKTEKKIAFNSKIASNDLRGKLLNIQKWMKKGHQVKVFLNSTGTKEDMDRVFSVIQEEVARLQGRITQSQETTNSLKFYISLAKREKSGEQERQGHKNHKGGVETRLKGHDNEGAT